MGFLSQILRPGLAVRQQVGAPRFIPGLAQAVPGAVSGRAPVGVRPPPLAFGAPAGMPFAPLPQSPGAPGGAAASFGRLPVAGGPALGEIGPGPSLDVGFPTFRGQPTGGGLVSGPRGRTPPTPDYSNVGPKNRARLWAEGGRVGPVPSRDAFAEAMGRAVAPSRGRAGALGKKKRGFLGAGF